ncbi:MAG: LytR C-terminal domain-containing protein [Micromonosporaceae bacterium]
MTLSRVRALLVMGTLVAVAAGFVIWAIVRDSQSVAERPERTCPEGAVPAATAIPAPKKVKINVYNDTDKDGLASSVAEQLKTRGFQVGKVRNDPDPAPVKGSAELRYGPAGLGSAHLLRAYFTDAQPEPDVERTGSTVDVVLGMEFRQLATPAEVNDALRLIGDPSPPPGMC